MKIITSYILKQIIAGFLILTLSLLSIVWLSQSLRFINMTIGKGLPFSIFIKITILLIPKFLIVLSPISLFAVILFVYNRMSADRELIVLKSSSFSNFELAKAPIITSFFLTLVGFVLSLKIIPETHMAFRDLQWQIRNDVSHLIVQEGAFNSIDNNTTVYVEEIDSKNNLKNIIINIKSKDKNATVLAKNGALVYSNGVPKIIMQEGSRQELDNKTKIFSVLHFDSYTMDFDSILETEKKRNMKYEELYVKDLKQMLENKNISKQEVLKIKSEINDRLSKPLYNFAFGLLGCVGMLLGHFNRRGSVLKTCFMISIMVVIQSLSLSIENLSSRNDNFIFFMYTLPCFVIISCFYLLINDYPLRPFLNFYCLIKNFFIKSNKS
ncbi:MAG: putative permease YjgP/YjgQ family protein [Alphaproteobacteria bacterium ADurb.Bin438]|nr:MAG: putative permease YjgP/YjgQ family protein [Alphaproteobacteria bacterium ADurb.Bin438]